MPNQIITRAGIGLLILMALAAAFVLGNYDWLSGAKDVKRSRLAMAASAMKLGATGPEAASVLIETLGPGGLHVHRAEDTGQWYVSNGHEFFETNWVMTLCFQQDRLTGVRFGTADDVDRSPTGAPASTGVCA